MQPLTSHVETSSATLRITGTVTRSAVESGSSTLPQPPPSSLEHDSPTKGKGKKRKREDDDDEGDDGDDDDDGDDPAYQGQHNIFTAQSLVQQVMSNPMSVKKMLRCRLCRRGHKPYESMGLSSSFTPAITSSCVSAIEALRRFMFRTSSNRPRALTLAMGNSMWAFISPPSKT